MRLQLRAMAVALTLVIVASAAHAAPRRRLVRMPEVTSTLERIDQAEESGEIDSETALVYRVLANFDDPRLPEQYRGSVTTFGVDTFALADAMVRYDSLSAGAKEIVTPFLIPPFHEGSWHDLRTGDHGAVRAADFAICGPAGFGWSSVLAPSRLVRIWWDDDNPADAAVAASLVGVAERALLMFSGLLGRNTLPDGGTPCRGGDDAIDVALVDAGSQTIPFLPGTKQVPSYVLLQRNAPDGVAMTLVHELFHVMQFTYNVQGGVIHADYKWLMESTAAWAQHHYSPAGDSGKEQRAAPLYLSQPEKSLDFVNSKHEYGAYLFFLYLTSNFGDGVVKSVWDATAARDQIGAVDSAIPGGFRERWPEFALYNWNRDPVDHYNRLDKLTAGVTARGGTLLSGGQDQHAALLVDLPRLSATYKHFVFNERARSVAFLNGLTFKVTKGSTPPFGALEFGTQYRWSNLSADERRGASVQAIIKKGGKWQAPEVWTEEPYKAFCRQKKDERIEEIVLIFANSDTDENRTLQPAELTPLLVVTNVGCRWEGNVSFTISNQLAAGVGNLKVTYEVKRDPLDPAMVVDHFLGYAYSKADTAKFEVSGSVGACRAEGGGDLPLRDIVQFTFNFAPPESSSYRRAYFVLNVPQTIDYTLHCPDGSGAVKTGFGTAFPRDLTQYLTIDAVGWVKGESQEIDGRFEWEIKPVDEP